MARIKDNQNNNALLAALSPKDSDLLQSQLSAIVLPLRFELEQPNEPIKHAYFMDEGVASVVAVADGKSIEIGLIGREGMSGMSVVMGQDRSPHSTYMQIGGRGRRITASSLRRATDQSKTLRHALLAFAQAFMVQTAHTAIANGRANIDQRLARRLLMAHDRVDGDAIPLTHEFLSLMLGVRRAGVTVALNALTVLGSIKRNRGLIMVVDRKSIEAIAGSYYGVPEAELRRRH